MGLLTFRGGVHPDDHKRDTEAVAIRQADIPEILVYPMSQHIGAPCEPTVSVGDQVYMGQIIGDSEAFVSVPVHTSVSGRVAAIEPRPISGGRMVTSVIVENDFQYTLDPSLKGHDDLTTIPPAEIPKIVRKAGIVGMGGATFPTHVKLSPPEGKKITTVIVNGAECEPYLTSDYRVMMEGPEEVVFGLKAVLHRFGITEGYIAIENNKPEAIRMMQKYVTDGIQVKKLKTKYPQGSEKQLIWAVTKKEVPSGGLPADVGVVVINIDTCVAISRAVRMGRPIMRRIVTVSGGAVKEPANFEVKLGTPVDFLLEHAGGFREDPVKVVLGGPMMGIAQERLDIPVTKGVGAVLAFTHDEVYEREESPCVRCGKCATACPMNLMPLDLAAYAEAADWDKCEEYGVMDCIECGCCAYLCPGDRHPVQWIKIAKQAIRERSKGGKQA